MWVILLALPFLKICHRRLNLRCHPVVLFGFLAQLWFRHRCLEAILFLFLWMTFFGSFILFDLFDWGRFRLHQLLLKLDRVRFLVSLKADQQLFDLRHRQTHEHLLNSVTFHLYTSAVFNHKTWNISFNELMANSLLKGRWEELIQLLSHLGLGVVEGTDAQVEDVVYFWAGRFEQQEGAVVSEKLDVICQNLTLFNIKVLKLNQRIAFRGKFIA